MAEGYEAPIPQALWRRVTMYGIPTVWFAVWFGAAVLQFIFSLARFGLGWGIALGIALPGIELAMARWITRQDMQWDELWVTHLARRYANFYE